MSTFTALKLPSFQGRCSLLVRIAMLVRLSDLADTS